MLSLNVLWLCRASDGAGGDCGGNSGPSGGPAAAAAANAAIFAWIWALGFRFFSISLRLALWPSNGESWPLMLITVGYFPHDFSSNLSAPFPANFSADFTSLRTFAAVKLASRLVSGVDSTVFREGSGRAGSGRAGTGTEANSLRWRRRALDKVCVNSSCSRLLTQESVALVVWWAASLRTGRKSSFDGSLCCVEYVPIDSRTPALALLALLALLATCGSIGGSADRVWLEMDRKLRSASAEWMERDRRSFQSSVSVGRGGGSGGGAERLATSTGCAFDCGCRLVRLSSSAGSLWLTCFAAFSNSNNEQMYHMDDRYQWPIQGR